MENNKNKGEIIMKTIKNKKTSYTKEQIESWKSKAEKWDNLDKEISKCYNNSDGEYDEENSEIPDSDLCTIGEMAAIAFGWL